MKNVEMAIEILRKTNDGNGLNPEHLKLLEMAVNGRLNKSGDAAFEDLYQSVINGYIKPWLHGVEHLTRNHAGYVFWKGQEIEHWSGDLPYSEKGKADALELSRRCQFLEKNNKVISTGSVIWNWDD